MTNLINGINYLQYFDIIYLELRLNFSDVCNLSIFESLFTIHTNIYIYMCVCVCVCMCVKYGVEY
jgi:hypothetical protein